jgi:NAD-reducing hydrogenase large subunit
MSRTITIDPLTRIEGHGKITIHLNDNGVVENALFHVTQFRGFEKLCEGRPFREMPSLMARICGICPVAHLIAGSKACDQILAVQIPEPAVRLRRIINLGQIIQSHALSFFYLSAPDLVLGMDMNPAERNIFGILKENPQMARDGIRLRQYGQQIIEMLAGERVHPSWIIAGGVSEPLTQKKRDSILAGIPEVQKIIQRNLDWFKSSLLETGKSSIRVSKFRDEIRSFANLQSLFLGLVNEQGELDFYDGKIRVVDSSGKIVADKLEPEKYGEYIAEKVEKWSYLKFPYYKPRGYADGMYRVGPLARLNIIDRCGTPQADLELTEFRGLSRGSVLSSFYYHYARLIEILFAIEKVDQLLNDPDILSDHVKAIAGPNNSEGVGVAEAPRGTLFHHYKVSKEGIMQSANLIIATGNNNLAMNKGILQVAKQFVKGDNIEEGMLNRVEAVIRAFDPCLSCSTHAIGKMPLHIELINTQGDVLDEQRRD